MGRNGRNGGRGGRITAVSAVYGAGFANEWFETGTGDARARARQLRELGFRVALESSVQLTRVGWVKLTLVSVHPGPSGRLPSREEMPAIAVVESGAKVAVR